MWWARWRGARAARTRVRPPEAAPGPAAARSTRQSRNTSPRTCCATNAARAARASGVRGENWFPFRAPSGCPQSNVSRRKNITPLSVMFSTGCPGSPVISTRPFE